MRTPSPNELLVVEGLDKAFTLHLHGGARLPVVSNVAFTVGAASAWCWAARLASASLRS